jgi:hypothetical protein
VKLGIALPEAVHGDDESIVAALDRFTASVALPRLFAVWRSLTPGPRYGMPSAWLLDALEARGVVPLVYLESSPTKAHYDNVKLHHRLTDCALFAEQAKAYGKRVFVRLDHEMNGSMPWAGQPERYKLAWRAQTDILHDAPNIRMVWCPQGATPDRFASYWPGDDYVDLAGFDKYDNGRRNPLPKAWAAPIAAIRELTMLPILVCEWGSIVGADDAARVAQLKTLEDVGVWGSVYFDIDVAAIPGSGDDRDWRMSPAMRDEYARMLRG